MVDDDDDDDDRDADRGVPVAFTETVKRRDAEELQPFTLESLKGENVVVRANGFTYRGKLVGADEGELYLRGELRWVVLPLATVTSVTLAKVEPPLGLPAVLDGGATPRDGDDT